MLRRMPAPVLFRWMEYDRLEPFGSRAGTWQAAEICAMTLNAALFVRTGKMALHFHPKDFLLVFGDEPAAADAEVPTDNVAKMKGIARRLTRLSQRTPFEPKDNRRVRRPRGRNS